MSRRGDEQDTGREAPAGAEEGVISKVGGDPEEEMSEPGGGPGCR